jgi:hypothetical protein
MCLNVASRRAWSRAGCSSGSITLVIPVMAGHRFRVIYKPVRPRRGALRPTYYSGSKSAHDTIDFQCAKMGTFNDNYPYTPRSETLSFDSYSMKSVHQTIESSHTHKSLEPHKTNQAYSRDNFVIHPANGRYSREKRVSLPYRTTSNVTSALSATCLLLVQMILRLRKYPIPQMRAPLWCSRLNQILTLRSLRLRKRSPCTKIYELQISPIDLSRFTDTY